MKKYLFVTIVCSLLLSVTNVKAQNLNDKFEQNKKAMTDRIDIYRSKVIRNYTNLREGIWKRFDEFKICKSPEDHIGPVTINYSDTSVIKFNGRSVDIAIPHIESDHSSHIESIKANSNNIDTLTILFYNNPLLIHYAITDIPDFNVNYDNQIADAWDLLHTGVQSSVLRDCLYYKEQFRLCDWAYLNLIIKVANSIYSGDKAIMLASYLYSESGYEMCIGRTNGSLVLLASTHHEIYDQYYITLGDKFFFPVMYSGNYSFMEICYAPNEGKKPLSLYIVENQKLFNDDSIINKTIDISDLNQKPEKMQYGVYISLLDFYENYPTSRINGNDMTRWALYAETPINDKTRSDIYMQFTDILKDKNELDAANFLLNYVQTKFRYGEDRKDDLIDTYSDYYDRVYFAEETLVYPFSDCEDRSILFSHFIRDLLGLDVVLLYTPGHLFTAVCFNDEVNGDYITIDNRKFIICEPTCTNGAPVGWAAEEIIDCNYILLKKINYDIDYRIISESQNNKVKRSLFPICVDGKWGYKNEFGELVVDCIYDKVSDNAEYGDLHCYTLYKDGEITICTSSLSSDNNGWIFPHYYGYIPLDLQQKDSIPLYYDVIVKDLEGWHIRNLVVDGEPDYDFFKPYDMQSVTYDLNVYCESVQDYEYPKYYIILKHTETNKYGVIYLNGKTIHIPFIYDYICFDNDDKSKVMLSLNGKTEIVKLRDYK